MITLLETLVDGADGAYASKQDLRNLEHAMSSWSERKAAYLAVEANEKSIIDRARRSMENDKLFHENNRLNPAMLECCCRDMTLTLRSYALGMLLQDEEMLKDRFIYWHKNILQSMDLAKYQGSKFVYDSICIELPREQSKLFKPYFKIDSEITASPELN
ncbi:phycobilisome protein [Chamaesiphon sp. GL140_3_metabinner_50]|uniref:phycobilisome protein n=1 Tax=Chamaesiphon sp. GL140_3_metabinner_50 TaxID=2970812 RepID=UPI0025FA5975|nr:phycobilisome protein [Chamaesiphon sp. GL140_3_metabinner_50]